MHIIVCWITETNWLLDVSKKYPPQNSTGGGLGDCSWLSRPSGPIWGEVQRGGRDRALLFALSFCKHGHVKRQGGPQVWEYLLLNQSGHSWLSAGLLREPCWTSSTLALCARPPGRGTVRTAEISWPGSPQPILSSSQLFWPHFLKELAVLGSFAVSSSRSYLGHLGDHNLKICSCCSPGWPCLQHPFTLTFLVLSWHASTGALAFSPLLSMSMLQLPSLRLRPNMRQVKAKAW